MAKTVGRNFWRVVLFFANFFNVAPVANQTQKNLAKFAYTHHHIMKFLNKKDTSIFSAIEMELIIQIWHLGFLLVNWGHFFHHKSFPYGLKLYFLGRNLAKVRQ